MGEVATASTASTTTMNAECGQTASSTQTELRESPHEGGDQELHLLPLGPSIAEMYKNHGTYHTGDSGLDLFVAESTVVQPGATEFIKLGVKAAAFNHSGRNVGFLIMPRSSISKTPLRVANSVGLVDAGFRGELVCAVDNIKTEAYEISKGDRLVQAVFFNGEPFQMKLVEALSETQRGSKGWGSTNVAMEGSSTDRGADSAPQLATKAVRHQNNVEPCAGVDDENVAPSGDVAQQQQQLASKKRSSAGSATAEVGSVSTMPQDEEVAARKKQRMDAPTAEVDAPAAVPTA